MAWTRVTGRVTLQMCALVAAVACSREALPTSPTPVSPAPAPMVRLSGRLVDYQTGQGVAGTTVQWQPRQDTGGGGFAAASMVSGADGRYEVALPPADYFSYQIQTGPINFLSGTVRAPGKRLDTDIFVNGGPCAARYGFVFDAVTREPIAGARVTRAGSAVTDAHGRYQIDIGCEPRDAAYWGIGTTTISVQHPAYEGTSQLDGRRESTSYSGVRRIDFSLQPLATR